MNTEPILRMSFRYYGVNCIIFGRSQRVLNDLNVYLYVGLLNTVQLVNDIIYFSLLFFLLTKVSKHTIIWETLL